MDIVLNVTKKASTDFNTQQRLAVSGRCVFDVPVSTAEEFCKAYDAVRYKVVEVIVDSRSENYELNNDICNSVGSWCKVVTLNTELDVDTGTVRFMEYDPDDL